MTKNLVNVWTQALVLGFRQPLSTILQCFDEDPSSEIAFARFSKTISTCSYHVLGGRTEYFINVRVWVLWRLINVQLPFLRKLQAQKEMLLLGLSMLHVRGEHFALLRFTLQWWTIHLGIFCEAVTSFLLLSQPSTSFVHLSSLLVTTQESHSFAT